MTKALLAGISAALLVIAAGGCVIETVSGPPSGVAVSGPPPEPMREARMPPPQGTPALWIAGYWHWTGLQYTWIPGHWVVPPAGSRWRAPQYSLHDGTYFYEPGGWTGPR